MVKLNQKIVAVICLAVGFLAGLPAFAALVPINNSGFENPVTGSYVVGTITDWTITGGPAGVWQPAAFPGTAAPAPQGSQTGFIGNASPITGSGISVSQILSTDLQSNTKYVLSIAVGGRTDGYNPGIGYSVSLYSGATLLSSVVPVTPPTSAWTYLTTTFTSGIVAPGNPLQIVIAMPGAGETTQLLFDDVTLNATPVPEPATMIAGALLLLPFGVSTLRILRKNRTA